MAIVPSFKSKRGFTIFFAVLVASLSLSVGLVIYDILLRSLSLSQVARESQYAIYAADSGAECALYWDLKYTDIAPSDQDGGAFATSSLELASDIGGSSGVVCNNQNIVTGSAPISTAWDYASQSGPNYATTTFWFSMGTALRDPCVKVEVGKFGNPSQTTVVSHGYNTCTSGATLRLERTLQVSY